MIEHFIFIMRVCTILNTPYNCQSLYEDCMRRMVHEPRLTYIKKQIICLNALEEEIVKLRSK